MKTFNEALLEAAADRGWSLSKVAEEAGVSYEMLKKLKQRPNSKINIKDGVLVARAFGMTVNEFIGEVEESDQTETIRLLSNMSDQAREAIVDDEPPQPAALDRPTD